MKKDKKNTEVKEKIEDTVSEESEQQDKKFFSDKKTVVRFICFIIALVTAVAFITYGVANIGHKDEGIYDIECEVDKEAPHYFAGITFRYNFTGTSSQINSLMKIIKNDYSSKLKYCRKLFDPENTYEGLVNIAYINRNMGKAVEVGEELFETLTDAYVKTLENKGYDMFGGIKADIRDSLVYAFDPEEHDIIYDDDLKELINKIDEVTSSADCVRFELDAGKRTVLFDLSEEYKALIKEYGIESPVIDLDLLSDAYTLKYVVRALENAGYTDGYITTADGISIILSGMSKGEFCLYSNKTVSEGAVASATVPAEGGKACSSFRIFSLYDGETGFYTVENDGKTLYRNKYLSDLCKDTFVASAVSVTDEFSAVEAVYSNIVLLYSSDAESAKQAAKDSKCGAVLFESAEREKNVYVKSAGTVKINAESGYSAVTVK